MASGPITSWEIDGETVETVSDLILGGSKITADGDCGHEIKICLLLRRKVMTNLVQFSSVQSFSRVRLFATPWIAACQAFLSITNSWSSLKLMSIESVMPSSPLILCWPLLLLPSIFPSIRVFPDKKSQGWSSEWIGCISLQSKGPSRVFSNTTVQKHQFFSARPSSQSNSHIHTWPLEKP